MIATDGAGSAVRNAMLHGGVERFDFSQIWLEHGYKELHIPATADGGFRLEKNALHIWPRHQFMMIALPNFDGSLRVHCSSLFPTKEHNSTRRFPPLTDLRLRAMFEIF
ncbi:MAG: hypothetical protein IPK98_12305 [Chloracidobacterium sp.]|nr:hypothetical protein [Chloracidobacterium sp.]